MPKPHCTFLRAASAFAIGLLVQTVSAQDECTTAIPAVIGGNPFNTTAATTSPEPVDDTQCPGTWLAWGFANKDVWFSYTAPTAGYLNLDTCLASSFDTSLVVYTGSCGALTQIACNGDSVGIANCQAFYSAVSQIEANAGTTYYIRIGGWTDPDTGVPEFGAGSLTLNFQPINPVCFGATGSCGLPHGTGGCDDATCCSAVCDFDAACCDASWTADCVTYAVDLCGIFVYNCTGSTQANDCAINATVLTTDTFRDIDNNGANTDGPAHPGADCASGTDLFLNDLWYRAQAQANGTMTVQTCVVNGGPATTFDSKLAVYDMGTNPATFDFNTLPDAFVGCNDDGDATCAAGGGFFPSYLSVTVTQGHWYLIRVATYDIPGTARVTFDFAEPCVLPQHTVLESEACGGSANDGCTGGQMPQTITLGSTVRGRAWAANNFTQDIDWYQFEVDSLERVTVHLYSASFMTLELLKKDPGSACQPELIAQGSGICANTVTRCLEAGTYCIAVALDPAYGAVLCGSTGGRNDYVIETSSVEGVCPTIIGSACDSPGPDFAWSNNQAPPIGTNNLSSVVACAVNPPFPNCSAGAGTVANKYARVFTSGLLAGEISCFEVGFWSVRRNINAANTTCSSYISDLPLPATVYICHDVDGGNPRNLMAFAGDGNDLEVLSTRSVLVPGMADTGAINFDPPLCLDGVTGNIVVVLDIPNFLVAQGNIPAAQGYGLRPAGLTVAGQPSQVFVRLSCADAAGQFITAETLGSTFTSQWFVGASGRLSGCNTCLADCTRDGVVNSSDLAAVLAVWGQADASEGPLYPDVDEDGLVGPTDLAAVLDAWGPCD